MRIENSEIKKPAYRSDGFWQPHGILRAPPPIVVLRPTSRKELVGRKIIRCPNCRNILIDVDRNTLVRIFQTPKNKRKPNTPGLEFRKCFICKSEVGMIMT